MLVAAFVPSAGATEVQLCGIRLGHHAINLLDVYGNPDGIVVGSGEATAAQTPGGAGGVGAPGMEGGMMGAPAMMGPPGAGDMMGAGMSGPAMMGGAGGPGEMGMMAGAMGGPEGAMPTMGGAGAAVAAGGGAFPRWALPIWVTMRPGEVEWIYRKNDVVMGFVLDEFGYVTVIAVAGESCDWARTAMWRPHDFAQLGDDFKRIIYRYGYPDDTITFDTTGFQTAEPFAGPVSVTFNSNTRTFARDVIIRYTERNNIAFTFHNMRCTRIHIWSAL